MAKQFGRWFVVSMLLMIGVLSVQATNFVVTDASRQGWAIATDGVAPTYRFASNASAIGTGSFETEINVQGSKIALTPPVTGVSVTGLTFSWSSYTAPTSSKFLLFYVNVYIDRLVNGIGTYTNGFYDCRLNFEGSAPVGWNTKSVSSGTVADIIAGAGCSGNTLGSFAAGDIVRFMVWNTGDMGGAGSYVGYKGALDNVTINGDNYDFEGVATSGGSSTSGLSATALTDVRYFNDGRLNPHLEAPAIVYCFPFGVQIYGVNWETGRGSLLLNATQPEIDAVDTQPAVNTLIAKNGVASLYRLTTGEFQLNYGPYRNTLVPAVFAQELEYEFHWRDCNKFPSVRHIWDINTGLATLYEVLN